MAFCSKCGASHQDGAAFCPQCGATLSASAAPPPFAEIPHTPPPPPPPYSAQPPYTPPPYAATSGTESIQPNVAALLCYLGIWITGIIFLIVDKRPAVRFHAAQSLVFFGFLFLLRIALGFLLSSFYGIGLILFGLILLLVGLLGFVAWIVLMIFAYQGKRFEIPIVAGIAKSLMGSVNV